tara:strand:+ start:1169 stop:2125 length:957 start_codon:yes stop_codon:yes gene_type:complete
MSSAMATLHASRDIAVDPVHITYMAPYQISFWGFDGDNSGELFFQHLRNLLAEYERKELEPFPVFDQVVKKRFKTKLARAQRLEETIGRLKTSFKEKLNFIREEYKYHSVQVPYKDGLELVAYPDVAFFKEFDEGGKLHLPLLGMFSNEPSPGQEENVTPSYHPMYNKKFFEYSQRKDFSLYNFITQFRIYLKLTRDVKQDEELCWCYDHGNKYDRVGYEPATKCRVKLERDEDDIIDEPFVYAVSYTLLAYGLDLTDRIEHFRDTDHVTLDKMRAYYTSDAIQKKSFDESNAYAEIRFYAELVTNVGYSFFSRLSLE